MIENINNKNNLQKELVTAFPHYFFKIEEIKKELEKPFVKIIVFIENNEIQGFLNYSLIYDRIEINFIEVKEEKRKRGIAYKLLKKIEEEQIKNITLEVRCDNEIAIRLYEKVGFNKVAIRKNYYNGIDGILMEKKVGE